MGLKDLGETLPPGFRFNPSDEELVCHYLYKKIANEEVLKGTLVEIDLHTCEPWQLPDVAKLNASEWYFFSFRDRKYATGYRTNRATASGYWKATGKDRVVLDPNTQRMVGMRKTLVFYQNRAPNGVKTPWIMHEFRLETPHMPPKEDWVLCRVFYKAKGDTNMATSSSSPPLLDAYTVANTCECRIQTLTQNPNVVDPTLLNHSTHLLQLLKEGNATNYTITNSSRIDDDGHDHVDEAHEYEFLWNMGIYEAGLTNGGNRHNGLIGDTGFEDGNGIVLP